MRRGKVALEGVVQKRGFRASTAGSSRHSVDSTCTLPPTQVSSLTLAVLYDLLQSLTSLCNSPILGFYSLLFVVRDFVKNTVIG